MAKPKEKPKSIAEKINALLEKSSFDKLLKSGYVLNVESARKKLGYTAWGLRRACQAGKVGHFMRGDQYFFLPEQVSAAFTVVEPRT